MCFEHALLDPTKRRSFHRHMMCFIPRVSRHSSGILACFVILAMTICVACGEIRIEELVGDPLDPNVHRAHIVAIDAIVFEDGGLGEAQRKELETRWLALSQVASADPANIIAVNLGQNLRMLAAFATRTRVGTPLVNSQLRQQWLRMRGSLFDDAAWFRHSSADPIEPAIAGPPPPVRAPTRERRGADRIGPDPVVAQRPGRSREAGPPQ